MATVLGVGNLNNGTIDGRRIANLNNGLGNSNWNYAARISVIILSAVFRPRKGDSERTWADARNRHTSIGSLATYCRPCGEVDTGGG